MYALIEDRDVVSRRPSIGAPSWPMWSVVAELADAVQAARLAEAAVREELAEAQADLDEIAKSGAFRLANGLSRMRRMVSQSS